MRKIKITDTPKIKPLYQQDKKTFSLDTSVEFDKETEKGPAKFRNQYPEADREDANIEAEKGETILTPDMEHYTIGGKSHKKGGTPIRAEIGSFIFSNDKTLKIKGSLLSEFGINHEIKNAKKGFTPAEIAKKYKTNKFLAILRDPESDSLDKETASFVLQNMKDKLAKLSFIQESKKGFPDGIPSIAEEDEDKQIMKKGGLIKAQKGKGRIPDMLFEDWKGNPRYEDRSKFPIITPPTPKVPENKRRTRQVPKKPSEVGKNEVPKLPSYLWKPGDITDKDFLPVDEKMDVQYTDKRSYMDYSDEDLKTYELPYIETGYGPLDYVHMAAPYTIPLKKYPPIRTRVNPERVEFRPIDLEAQRQGIKGQVAQAQQANNILSGSDAIASARNSQLLGQALDPLNQSYMTEFNTNQAARMQVDTTNAQFRQQANMFNAQADDQYNVRNAITNENFDTERRVRLSQFLKGLDTAERNRQYRNAANVINRDFIMTADGRIVRRKLSPEQAQARLLSDSSGTGSQSMTYDQFISSLPQDVQGADPKWLFEQYQRAMSATYRGRDAQGVSVTSRNPYLIPQPYEYSTYPNQ